MLADDSARGSAIRSPGSGVCELFASGDDFEVEIVTSGEICPDVYPERSLGVCSSELANMSRFWRVLFIVYILLALFSRTENETGGDRPVHWY